MGFFTELLLFLFWGFFRVLLLFWSSFEWLDDLSFWPAICLAGSTNNVLLLSKEVEHY